MIGRGLALCAMLALPLVAAAQDEKELGWHGKATLGYLATTGNTENTSLNTGLEVGYKTQNWNHLATFAAINATQNEVTNAEAYDAGWKSEWEMSEKSFFFGRLVWRKDRFGPYATQFTQSVGYGRRLIGSEKHKLNVDAGIGARQSEDQFGLKNDETILRGGLDYIFNLSETAEFRQDLTVESGGDNTYLESYTALSAKIIGAVALVASYTVKHNTDVPLLTEKTDTYTALSLEYPFK